MGRSEGAIVPNELDQVRQSSLPQAETIELFSQKEILDARIIRTAMLTLVLRSVMPVYSVR